MKKLYVWKTPNGYKPVIMMEELAAAGMPIEYQLMPVNLQKGEQKTPEFQTMNPNGKIPVLLDEDAEGGALTLFESASILEYLAEKGGMLMPKDEHGRYLVKEWLTFTVAGMGPSFGQLSHYIKYATEQVPYAIERAKMEAMRVLGVLEKRLGEAEYLASEYSIADISAWAWTRAVKTLEAIDFSEFPHVERWYAAIEARPGVKQGIEKTDAACQ